MSTMKPLWFVTDMDRTEVKVFDKEKDAVWHARTSVGAMRARFKGKGYYEYAHYDPDTDIGRERYVLSEDYLKTWGGEDILQGPNKRDAAQILAFMESKARGIKKGSVAIERIELVGGVKNNGWSAHDVDFVVKCTHSPGEMTDEQSEREHMDCFKIIDDIMLQMQCVLSGEPGEEGGLIVSQPYGCKLGDKKITVDVFPGLFEEGE